MQFIRFSAVPFLGSEGYWAFSSSSNTVSHDFHIYTLWEILSGLSFITAYDIFIQKILSTIVKNARCLQSLVYLWVCHTKSIENTYFQLKFYLPRLNPLVKLLDILKSIANVFLILRCFFHKDWYTLLSRERISKSKSDPVSTELKKKASTRRSVFCQRLTK